MQLRLWCLIGITGLVTSLLAERVASLEGEVRYLSSRVDVETRTAAASPLLRQLEPRDLSAASLRMATPHIGLDFRVGWFGWVEALCLLSLLTAILLSLRLIGDMRRHQDIVAAMARHRRPLAPRQARSTLLELTGDLLHTNRLTAELASIAGQIRLAAGDNAHALKSPLSVIKIALRRVRTEMPMQSAMVTAALDAADANVERMAQVIETSQLLEEEAAGLIVAPREVVELRSLVRECVHGYVHGVIARRLRLDSYLQSDIRVLAPAGMLDGLLDNLLDNAIAASPCGATLGIFLEIKDQWAVLRIVDEGAGIPADGEEFAFERDYEMRGSGVMQSLDKVPPRGRRRYFVAKRNTDLLGGDFTIANRPHSGVSAIVRLPLLLF
jgi:signal transduction histidine kinase